MRTIKDSLLESVVGGKNGKGSLKWLATKARVRDALIAKGNVIAADNQQEQIDDASPPPPPPPA